MPARSDARITAGIFSLITVFMGIVSPHALISGDVKMESRYLVLLTVLLSAVAVYGILTLQILMGGTLMAAILCVALCLEVNTSSPPGNRGIKQAARFFIALMATLYGLISTQWLVPCFAMTLLFAGYINSDIKDWMDARQERYLAALRVMNTGRGRE